MSSDDNLKAALEASLGMVAYTRAGVVWPKDIGASHQPPPWPDPASLIHVTKNHHRYYRFLDGSHPDLPGVTSILKASLGLSRESLVSWAAKVERIACFDAAATAYATAGAKGRDAFMAQMGQNLGDVKAHQKIMDQAADLGTAAHDAIRWTLQQELGQDAGPKPVLQEASLRAYSAFQEYWRGAGLKAIRMEQPVYDLEWGYSGTIDLVAEHPTKGLGVIDLKTSKAIYSEAHFQVASYLRAGRNFADLKWGELVRLPKTSEGSFEVVPLGQLWDRTLSEAELLAVFQAALNVFRLVVHKEAA